MSQVTEQSVRFQTALASIKLIQASAVLDLTEDDFDFLTSNKVWIATDRSRARRCVEACVYGTDRKSGSAGMPRPNSYAVFCLKKKNRNGLHDPLQVVDFAAGQSHQNRHCGTDVATWNNNSADQPRA